MTGFGRASGTVGDRLTVTITVRSVNHRFLETSARLPEALWELEPLVRSTISNRFARGKVDVSVRARTHEGSAPAMRVNRDTAGALLTELRELSASIADAGEIALRDVIGFPGVVESISDDDEVDDRCRSDFAAVLEVALDRMGAMRDAEGAGLRSEIESRLASIGALRDDIAARRDAIVAEALDAYRKRVAEIASQAGADVDPDRLAQETVLQVERGDVAEELARLEIHVGQARELLVGKDPAGKKLDFLSQEMLREVNTIGSKSRASEIRTLVIELKSEIERVREQVQNVE